MTTRDLKTGMDYSTKVTIESGLNQRLNSQCQIDAASSSSPPPPPPPPSSSSLLSSSSSLSSLSTTSLSPVEQSDGSYSCSVCQIVLTTSRDLTNHLRSHNLSPRSTDNSGNEEGYCCSICNKILSSASSLTRHSFVHTNERPFKCNYCAMAFTTNGNMNRHLRTAHREVSPQQIYTDSECTSSDSDRLSTQRRHIEEYNNNEVSKRHSPDIIDKESFPPKLQITKRKRANYDNDIDNSNRKYKIMLNNSRNEIKNIQVENNDVKIVCPVCGVNDLNTEELMDKHLQEKHPDYTPDCDLCNQKFKSYHNLVLHQYVTHYSSHNSTVNGNDLKNSVIGFPDLTFMDFSADKFPTVARVVCEQSIHRPATGESATFQCTKCSRAFPCRSALNSHEIDCGNSSFNSSAISIATAPMESDDNQDEGGGGDGDININSNKLRRDHFFAGLDLQNKAALNEAKEGKDLADIQSIISVTSGPIFPRSDASTPEHQVRINPSIGSSGSSGTASSEYHGDEEPQDPCAAEFRRMKAKGEFPCRLCSAIFPNLRALKGHNRAHTNVPTGMPYPCNMCPYTSTDKQTLTRHLRHHNGDRPFQCALCGYQFTTKANCERHVKNRHGRLTKEDVRDALIQKPCDEFIDDTNDNNSSRTVKDDVRKSLIYPNDRDEFRHHHHHHPRHRLRQNHQTNPYQIYPMDPSRHHETAMSEVTPRFHDIISPLLNNPSINLFNRRNLLLQHNGDSSIESINRNILEESENLKDTSSIRQSDNNSQLNDNDSRSSEDGSVSLVNETNPSDSSHQRIQSSPIDLLHQNSNVNNNNNNNNNINNNEDAPLDLSMDVLDLSKKSREKKSNQQSLTDNIERNNNNNNNEDLYEARNKLLLTQALLNASQSAGGSNGSTPSLEALYAANAQLFYGNFGGFPNASGILPAYIFNQHYYNQEIAMRDRLQKELVRGLQLTSGGTLVEPPPPSMNHRQSTQVNYPKNYSSPHEILPQNIKNEHNQQQQQQQQVQQQQQRDYSSRIPTNITSVCAPSSSSTSRELIDNSSNAPQKLVIKNGILVPKQKQRRYRTERPFNCGHCSAKFTLRSNMERHVKQQHPKLYIHKSRGGHSTRGRPPANPSTLLPSISHHQQLQQSYRNIQSNTESVSGNNSNPAISDQVKYAILAQQLKANRNDDNDTDEELIIDESGNNVNGKESERRNDNETSSLLRGKLEENIKIENTSNNSQSPIDDDKLSNNNNNNNNDEKNNLIEIKSEREEFPETNNNDIDDNDEDDDDDDDNNDDNDDNDDGKDNDNDIHGDDGKDTETIKTVGKVKSEDGNADLASVSELLDNASQQYQQFQPPYMSDEEGLVASNSDCNNSGSDEKSDSINSGNSGNSSTSQLKKKRKKMKKSAYSMAPNRVICPYCQRPFPWTSSLRRHILTHTGQKPYQCVHCLLLFTTKSNCDRHLLRKHKTNSTKMRRRRNTSSPEIQESSTKSNNNVNNNNDTSTNNNNNNSNVAFLMRNVPERPYKCNKCPSSTFSTLGNLRKHRSTKHFLFDEKFSSPESPVSESQSEQHTSPIPIIKQQNNDQSDCESPLSSASELVESTVQQRNNGTAINSTPSTSANNSNGKPRSRRPSPRSSPGPSDAPFKCHLCDSSFSERQDCLNHIKSSHKYCYKMLVAKGALKMDTENTDDPPVPQQHHSDGDEKRGKFPDYSSRKVVCAFCMRRFWSAEDLRRHMRTHSGERPFKCDVCKREFTLKHSMLRHRKKHESESGVALCGGTSGEEESTRTQSPTIITPRSQQQLIYTSASNRIERNSLPTMATVATGDAAPSGLMRFNPYENLATMTGKLNPSNIQSNSTHDPTPDNENDLISNLLGIRDRSIIDRVLQASADDAAKLLGVNRNHD